MVSYWLLPVLAAMATARQMHPEDAPRLPIPNVWSWALWCVVAVPSIAQLAAPQLLDHFRRDWSLITSGQLWRLVTSVVVQDGGPVATGFNLLILAIVLLAAQNYWRPLKTCITFWFGAVSANLIVGPSLHPVGAGNSMATLAVATALALNVVVTRAPFRARAPAIGALACVALLLIVRDYHGYAALPGLLAGLVPAGRRPVPPTRA